MRFVGKNVFIQNEFSEHITVYTWCNLPVCWMLLGGSVEIFLIASFAPTDIVN